MCSDFVTFSCNTQSIPAKKCHHQNAYFLGIRSCRFNHRLPKGGWPELARVGGIRLRPCHPEEAQPTKDLFPGAGVWLGAARYKVNWRETDEGESESIAEDSLFSPSPVSCADILPRWGKNRMVRRIRGVVRIRRTVFVYSPVYRRAGTSRRPYTETSGMPVGATLVVARPKLSPREAGTGERTIST